MEDRSQGSIEGQKDALCSRGFLTSLLSFYFAQTHTHTHGCLAYVKRMSTHSHTHTCKPCWYVLKNIIILIKKQYATSYEAWCKKKPTHTNTIIVVVYLPFVLKMSSSRHSETVDSILVHGKGCALCIEKSGKHTSTVYHLARQSGKLII